ncbi:MAG: class I SAM-dependent methyltransferase family protein [Methanomicrobiales archaeon]|nr:class I SAM-dependent methyltransferase family protein [Methanomicrobiales archaeon]
MGLKKQLEGVLPAGALPFVSDHFEVIGDIAVLSLPVELELYGKIIAASIVAHRKNIYTVLNKNEQIRGPSRTARYEVLCGETTVTVYREFGFMYRFDVTRSFFSTRLAYERNRVTAQVEPGERVYVPFAGVGPFAIPAAARGAEVWAVEMNPDAFRWLTENIRLNHVETRCHARQGDALAVAALPVHRFDRIIIPAPYGMDHALDSFLPCLACGGMAHWYTFKTKEEIPALLQEFESRGLTVTFYSDCGNVAPGVSRYVFDLAQ